MPLDTAWLPRSKPMKSMCWRNAKSRNSVGRCHAALRHDGKFTQELFPFTGIPVEGAGYYTPALLLTLGYAKRHPSLKA